MGKYGNGIKVSDGNGNGMGMGMKSLKWQGIGTKNLFPHTSSSDPPTANGAGSVEKVCNHGSGNSCKPTSTENFGFHCRRSQHLLG